MNHSLKKTLICTALAFSYTVGCVFGNVSVDLTQSTTDTQSHQRAVAQNAPSANDFTDVKSDAWYFDYVDALVKRGVINGTSPTTFSPSGSFSIAECAAVISRYLGLEKEAARLKKLMEDYKKQGSELWYSGYMQVLLNTKILTIPEFVPDKDGLLNLTRELCERPIKRYEFADCIANSFDLSDSPVKARNNFKEISGLGHEFICGGSYDMSTVSTYTLFISDYEEIPQKSRENVLKTYYDGIFNGDVSGNFYPNNNLTRAEMAKVIAAVSDFNMRTRLLTPNVRNIPLDTLSFVTDSQGQVYMSNTSSQKVLLEQSKGIEVQNGVVTYSLTNTAPMGYAIDVYLYTANPDGIYSLSAQSTLHTSVPTEAKQFTYEFGSSPAKALLVLRNLSQSSRPEGTMEIVLGQQGLQSYDFCYREPEKLEIVPKKDQ